MKSRKKKKIVGTTLLSSKKKLDHVKSTGYKARSTKNGRQL